MYRGLFLSAASNLINEETPGQCFPKLLTIFTKSSIVGVRLVHKYTSVLPPDLKPIYKRLSSVKVSDKKSNSSNCNFREVLVTLVIGLLSVNGIRFLTQQRVSFLLPFVYRSICWQMFFKIGVLKNFAIFSGKHLCWSLILVKLRA